MEMWIREYTSPPTITKVKIKIMNIRCEIVNILNMHASGPIHR